MSRIEDKAVERGVDHGVEWAVVPAPAWAPPSRWNGYARIPEGHPLRQHTGKTTVVLGHEVACGYVEVQEAADAAGLTRDLIGGSHELTYSDEDGWIGFDTLHFYDDEIGWTLPMVVEAAKWWARIISDLQAGDAS